MDFRVASEELVALNRRLNQAGDTGVRKALLAELKKAGEPAKAAARKAARDTLPTEGGLNEKVARSRFVVKVTTDGRGAGVSITASNPIDLDALDRGRLRHPLYGNRKHWYQQAVPDSWFTDAMQSVADEEVRDRLVAVLDDIIKQL